VQIDIAIKYLNISTTSPTASIVLSHTNSTSGEKLATNLRRIMATHRLVNSTTKSQDWLHYLAMSTCSIRNLGIKAKSVENAL
jgi:hypothetical protein